MLNIKIEDGENEHKKQYENTVEFYGDVQLRWAQIAARNAAIQAIANGVRTILLLMPTGIGKTNTIASTLDCVEIRDALKIKEDRKLRVVFIAHINRLLTQAERTFANSNNVELTLITPFTEWDAKIFEHCDLVVIDEAHHEAMMSIQLQLDKTVHKPIIGLTATDSRSDGMVIKFEKIINVCSREEAVAEGWLAETSIWSFIDTTGKNKLPLLQNVIKNYHEQMERAIIFVRTLAEVTVITDFINNTIGKRAVGLIKQSATEIDTILDDFSLGNYDFIVNCSKLGEGIDVKGCVSVVLGRNIGSYTDLNQYIGRSARPDSDSRIFELVNPISGTNLDTTVITGDPVMHKLCSPQPDGSFLEYDFHYKNTSFVDSSIVSGIQIRH